VTDIAALLFIDKKQLNNCSDSLDCQLYSIWNPYGWYLEYMPDAGNSKRYSKGDGENPAGAGKLPQGGGREERHQRRICRRRML
jgi:hypothetical protein